MSYAAILFDLDDTLCDVRSAAARVPADVVCAGRRFSERVAEELTASESVVRLVNDLAVERPVGVVTNGSARGQVAKLRRVLPGLRLDPVVISGVVGCRKPEPRIFELALDRLGLDPATVLFVGDDPWTDMYGASRVGLATCWLSHGRSTAELPCSADHVITQLSEVRGLFP